MWIQTASLPEIWPLDFQSEMQEMPVCPRRVVNKSPASELLSTAIIYERRSACFFELGCPSGDRSEHSSKCGEIVRWVEFHDKNRSAHDFLPS